MDNDKIPDKGNYCLIINMKKNSTIEIGAKGNLFFKKGYYVYVGSALGSLSKRVKRHLSNDKKKHWHVDYLLLNKNTEIKQVIYTYCTKKIECDISHNINKNTPNYIKSFGCTDCNCDSHLYYFDNYNEALESSIMSYENIGYKPYKWF